MGDRKDTVNAPPPPNTFLLYYWAVIFGGFAYLCIVMFLAWRAHRDNRALVYVMLLLQLSAIAGINVVIRAGIFGLDPATLVAIQRGIWGAALITSFAVVDIFNAARRGKQARAMRMWTFLTHVNSHREVSHGGD